MGTEQGEGDGAVPAEPAAKTMQVVVHSIAGEELLAMQCQADWIVSDIAGKVEPKLTGLWQVKLQLVDKVLQGNECLGDLASSGELVRASRTDGSLLARHRRRCLCGMGLQHSRSASGPSSNVSLVR